MSEHDRRIQFRNRCLMVIKTTVAGLARDAAPILLYELQALGQLLLGERHLLGAYADVRRYGRRALARRRVVQSRRCASAPFGLRTPS